MSDAPRFGPTRARATRLTPLERTGGRWPFNREHYREITAEEWRAWEWEEITFVGVPGEFRIYIQGRAVSSAPELPERPRW